MIFGDLYEAVENIDIRVVYGLKNGKMASAKYRITTLA